MANEITIIIKARNEANEAFRELPMEARVAGDKAGHAYAEGFKEGVGRLEEDVHIRETGEKIGDTLGESIDEHVSEKISTLSEKPAIEESGKRVGEKIGTSAGEGIGHKLESAIGTHLDDALQKRFERFASGEFESKIRPKADNRSFKDLIKSFAQAGVEAASNFMGAFGDAVSKVPLLPIAVSVAAVFASPLIGGAIASAMGLGLTGGLIALGWKGAASTKEGKQDVKEFKKTLKSDLQDFSKPFNSSFESLLGDPKDKSMGGITGLFKQLRPEIHALGQDLAPVADQLSKGIVGMLAKMLPLVMTAAKELKPVVSVLAEDMPGLGDAIGRFFKKIGDNGPNTAAFFDDLMGLINGTIDLFGTLVVALTNAWFKVKWFALNFVATLAAAYAMAARAAATAFGWIPGLGPKLKKAAADATAFATHVQVELNKIKDREVTVKIRAVFEGVGTAAMDVARILSHHATGGITGSASGATPSGLTWVGEHGPELINAPAGSRVWSHGDSARMARGVDGAGGMFIVQLHVDGKQMAAVTVDPIRKMVRQNYGGSVQAALGKG